MTSIRMNLVPATIGSIAMAWLASQPNTRLSEPTWSKIPLVRYRDAALSTHGDLVAPIQRASVVSAETASLMKFYADLLAGQQELGAEFEKVLYDNLWDLYAR
jgi:hypothetical protein